MNLCFSYIDENAFEIVTKKLSLQNIFTSGMLETGKETRMLSLKLWTPLLLPLFFFYLNNLAFSYCIINIFVCIYSMWIVATAGKSCLQTL